MILKKIYKELLAIGSDLYLLRMSLSERSQAVGSEGTPSPYGSEDGVHKDVVRLGTLLKGTGVTIKEFRIAASKEEWGDTSHLTHETRVLRSEALPVIRRLQAEHGKAEAASL